MAKFGRVTTVAISRTGELRCGRSAAQAFILGCRHSYYSDFNVPDNNAPEPPTLCLSILFPISALPAVVAACAIQIGWTEPRFFNDFEGTPLSGYAETKHTRDDHIDQIALNAEQTHVDHCTGSK